jgi:hypothetical protein
MSLFGPTDDTDYRRWQQHKLTALTALVEFGATKKLPPLSWRLPRGGGALLGEVETIGSDHAPRAVFDTWCAALADHPRVEPRGLGLRHDGPPRREHTSDSGQHRLTAGFTYHLVTDKPYPTADLAVIAEWWDDNPADPNQQTSSKDGNQ